MVSFTILIPARAILAAFFPSRGSAPSTAVSTQVAIAARMAGRRGVAGVISGHRTNRSRRLGGTALVKAVRFYIMPSIPSSPCSLGYTPLPTTAASARATTSPRAGRRRRWFILIRLLCPSKAAQRQVRCDTRRKYGGHGSSRNLQGAGIGVSHNCCDCTTYRSGQVGLAFFARYIRPGFLDRQLLLRGKGGRGREKKGCIHSSDESVSSKSLTWVTHIEKRESARERFRRA